MRSFFLYSLAAATLALSGCSAVGDVAGTTISGKIDNGGGLKVFLDQSRPNNQTTVLDQADSDSDGTFKMQLKDGVEPGIYRLRVGSKKVYLIFDGSEKNVVFDGGMPAMDRYTYKISGSPASEEFRQAMADLAARKMDVPGVQNFIETAKEPYGAMEFAIITLQNAPDFIDLHKKALERAVAKYGQNQITNDYSVFIANLERAYAQQMARERIKVGMPAPDIDMTGPDGKRHALSDLKGKVVLIDFWASWCGPCRKSNPHVVEIYKKYKDRGFTVYSVSLDGLDSRSRERLPNEQAIQQRLDASKKAWVAAIEKDKLAWPQHVSDLEKWDTKAVKMYGVTAIPKTFLVDRDGNIAAINPRYNLEEALLKVL